MSVEDKYEFLKVENARLQKENYELKTHIEGLEDGYHEIVTQLEAERDLYKPYYDALRKRHNSYDAEFREATGCVEPITPDDALMELLDEASCLAIDAPIHTVITNLKNERDKLTDDLAVQSVKLEEEKVKVHLLCNKIEDLKHYISLYQ